MTANGYEFLFGGDENVLKLDCGDGCTTLNIQKSIEMYSLNGWILWNVNYLNKAVKKNSEGFPGGTVVKNPPANAGDTGSSPGLGRSHMRQSN